MWHFEIDRNHENETQKIRREDYGHQSDQKCHSYFERFSYILYSLHDRTAQNIEAQA